MRRLGALLAFVGLGGSLGALAMGANALVAFFLALMIVGVGLRLISRGGSRSDGWVSEGTLAPQSLAARTRAPGADAAGTTKALARFEMREFIAHPAFAVGIGFCVFMVFGFAGRGETSGAWSHVAQDSSFLLHPLVGMAVLAAFMMSSRARRDGTEEMFHSCPTTARTRRAGLLTAACVPILAAGAFIASYLAATAAFNDEVVPPWGPVIPNLASGVVLALGGVALGIALGRWVRSPAIPVLALVLIAFIAPRLASGKGSIANSTAIFSTFPPVGDPSPVLTSSQAWARLAWLLVISAATAAVALWEPHEALPAADHSGIKIEAVAS